MEAFACLYLQLHTIIREMQFQMQVWMAIFLLELKFKQSPENAAIVLCLHMIKLESKMTPLDY